MRNLLIGVGIGLAVGILIGATIGPRRVAPAPAPRSGEEVGEVPDEPASPDAAAEAEPDEDEARPAAVPKRVTYLDQEIAEIRSLLGRSGEKPAERERKQIIELAYQIKSRTAYSGRRVPAELVRTLLASDDVWIRASGARLMARADPPMVEELEALYESATDRRIRPAIVEGLGAAGHDERLRTLLAKAVLDPTPDVHLVALRAVGKLERFVGLGEALGEAIVAATRSPAPKARHEAILLLYRVGAAAGERAVELVRDPEVDDRDERSAVAHVLVAAGRVREVLAADPSPEWVGAIVESLESPLTEDLGGLFEPLLPRFEPRNTDVAARYFRFAAEAGETDFVARVVRNRERGPDLRLAALRSELQHPGSRLVALGHAREILRSETETASFRKQVVDALAGLRELPDAVAADRRALLEEVSRRDPDRWVRERAARALEK